MEKVHLTYWPDLRDDIRFGGIYTLEECFEEIRAISDYFKEDLRFVDIYVNTEDNKPMFNISGCGLYQIKPGYECLEHRILEIVNEYFVDINKNND